MNKKILALNSTILFVIATLWQQTLHESAHFFSAVFFHSQDIILFHNYVQHNTSELPLTACLVIASAGPLFSLLIGILFHVICAFYTKRNLLFLFCLYMSVFGYINFGGYLMISPVFIGGDTGFVFYSLGFPLWLTICIALVGIVFLLLSVKMLGRYFVEMASEEIIQNKPERTVFIRSLIEYPLYIGVVVTVLLNLPVVTILSLLYPAFSPFTLFWGFGYFLNTPYSTEHANKEIHKLFAVSPILIGAFLLTVLCNRLLVYGWHW